MKKLIKKYFQTLNYIGYKGDVGPVSVIFGTLFFWLVIPLYFIVWFVGVMIDIVCYPFKFIANWLNR